MLLSSLVDRDDGILLDEPCYPGTKAILGPLGAKMIGVETDADGMNLKDLINKINEAKIKEIKLKAIMTVSNGGNPNGSTMSLTRRQKLIEIAEIYDLLIIEDDPYYFLQFDDSPLESIFSLDWNSNSPVKRTIRSDSLSKVVSAGIRVGWITGPNEIINKVELHTQASTMHCPALIQ
jgi:kynurenine/2-aminoadipate aminotransferase